MTRLILATAVAALASAPALASVAGSAPPDTGREAAVSACIDFNRQAPAKLVDVVGDGLGDFLVWVEDKSGRLWACNVSGEGAIYANLLMDGDLLEGKGLDLVKPVADSGWASPAITAERVCTAMASDGGLRVIGTVADGLDGYLVWLESEAGDLTMCNATGRGEVYAFETVDMPINDPGADGESQVS